MTSKRHTKVNEARIARARAVLDGLLDQALQHGFHGTVRLELTIAEGTIQRIGHLAEQIEKLSAIN